MADGDLRDQIAGIESDIEQLAERLDRCRKAMLFLSWSSLPVESGYWLL